MFMFEKQPGQVVVALPVHSFSAFYIEGFVFFGILYMSTNSIKFQIPGTPKEWDPFMVSFPYYSHYWGPIIGWGQFDQTPSSLEPLLAWHNGTCESCRDADGDPRLLGANDDGLKMS